MICGCTCFICFLYWPQWGGMFCGPKVSAQQQLLALSSSSFCEQPVLNKSPTV